MQRFAAYGNATKALFNQLVAHGAWADAVLLLLQFELPQWKVKRILYDDGEWHCLLSKQPQFPLGFDEGAEARHEAQSRGDADPPMWQQLWTFADAPRRDSNAA